MKTLNRFAQITGFSLMIVLLSGCGAAATPAPVLGANAPALTEATDTSAVVLGYQPVTAEVCQIIQEGATESLRLTFTMEASAPFTDYASGETGLGCTLTATTTGASISDPSDALAKLVSGFVGWTEDQKYAAGGPTGAATGMTRDAGLLLISVGWEPSADANCPADQPISACELTPEQKLYTVKIEAAMK